MRKLVASLLAVGLLLLGACGTGGNVEPGPVTSLEDIAGTYERHGPGGKSFIHLFEDGHWHVSSNRDLVEDRPEEIMKTGSRGRRWF